MADYNIGLGIDLNDLNSDLSKATNNMDDFVTTSKKAGKEVDEVLNKQKKGADDAVKSQKKLTDEVKKEAGIISKLETDLKSLKDARAKAHSLAEIKKYNKEIGETEKKLGDLTNKTEKSGKGLGGLFGGLGSSIKSMINPVTILTAGVIGLAGGYLKASKEISKLETITKNLFGDTEDTTQVVKKAREFASVYDQDVNEGLKTANVLVKEFDISATKAYDLIEQGIRRGADLNGDFLEQLKEYSSQFVSVGLNAEESIAIITQTVNRGVFSDKGVDLIKEAGIRLREMPQATKDALKAIGLNSQEIQKEIQNGTKTTFEVIQEVSSKTKEFGANAQETGLVLADVFGGAGEDAGKFVLELGDVKTDLEDITDNTGEMENAQQGVTRAWSRFVDNIASGDSIISDVFTGLLNFISETINLLDEMFTSSQTQLDNRLLSDQEEDAKISNKIIEDQYKRRLDLTKKGTEELEKIVSNGTEREIAFAQRIITARKNGISETNVLLSSLEEGIEREKKGYKELGIEVENQTKVTKKLADEVGFLDRLGGINLSDDSKKLFDAEADLDNLRSDYELRKATIEFGQSSIISTLKKLSVEQLEVEKKTASESLKVFIDNEIARKKVAEKQVSKRTSTTASKEVEKLVQDKAKLEAELLQMLQKLTEDTQKAVTDGLEGEEQINAILSNSKKDIEAQQIVLLQLNQEVGKNVAENKKQIIEDTAQLIFSAEEKAKEALKRLREGEDAQNINNTLGNIGEGGEIAQLQTQLDLKKQIGESEIEFEKRKSDAILTIQKQVAEEKLKFLIASGEDENSLRALQLKSLVADIEGKLNIGLEQSLKKSIADQFNDSLKSMFGINDEELANFKSSVSDLANVLIENYTSMIQGQIDEKTRLIDTYEENIQDIESQLDREISKNQEGNASNIKGLEEKLAREKELQTQAEKDREALMEKERKFRKAIAVAELIQNTALQISNLALAISRTAGETGAGAFVVVPALIGLLATVIGGVASLAQQPDTSGFFTGGYTGGKSIYEERGAVHGKEFVHTADKTAKHRNLFEGIHTDNNSLISKGLMDLLDGTGIELLKDAPERIALKQTAVNQGAKRDNTERYLKNIDENTKRQTKVEEERYINAKGQEVVKKGNTKITYE